MTSETSPTKPQPPKRGALDAEATARIAQKRLKRVCPSRRSKVAERLKSIPVRARLGYLAAAAGKASPRNAIKAFCLECVCWDRAEVRQCTSLACPMYAYRPFK